MKKIVTGFVIVILIVFVVLSVLGSGGEYDAEKMLYWALRDGQKINVNPDVAPPRLVRAVEDKLRAISLKYPKTATGKSSYMRLAEFYILLKKYDKAFETIDAVMKKYPTDKATMSMAQFLRGVIYERQDNWNKALDEFTILRNKYADTPIGLEIPMYIARHHESLEEKDDARMAYAEAAAYYEKLENQYQGKMLGYAASGFMIQALLNNKDYARAGSAVEGIINKYPANFTLNRYLPYIEHIYVRELKQPAKAIEIYSKLREKSKDKQFNEVLDKRIAELRSGKK